MFDIEKFIDRVAGTAYQSDNWVYAIRDILGFYDGQAKRDLHTLAQSSRTVIISWRMAGVSAGTFDEVLPPTNFEIVVSATKVRALNAFHWALMVAIRDENDVSLTTLIGDVDEDSLQGPRRSVTGRAQRAWGLTVAGPVTGMESI